MPIGGQTFYLNTCSSFNGLFLLLSGLLGEVVIEAKETSWPGYRGQGEAALVWAGHRDWSNCFVDAEPEYVTEKEKFNFWDDQNFKQGNISFPIKPFRAM